MFPHDAHGRLNWDPGSFSADHPSVPIVSGVTEGALFHLVFRFFHPNCHMRLSSLSHEVLPQTLVDALRTLGIHSDADLLLSATTLEIWRRLPPDLISFSEFERCVKAVLLRCAVPGFVATEVDKRPASDKLKPEASTGVEDLDNLLGTTLRDSVVEISGRQGSAATV